MSENVTGSAADKMLEKLRASGLPMSDDMQHRVVAGALALKAAVSRLSEHLGDLPARTTENTDQGEAAR